MHFMAYCFLPTHNTDFPTWGTPPTSASSSRQPLVPPSSSPPVITVSEFIPPLEFAMEPVTLTVAPHGPHKAILDADLLREDGHPRFFVSTDASRTVIEDASRHRVALIDWNRSGTPTVLIDELGFPMKASEWLQLASSRTCRTMLVHGRQFSWRPNGKSIELFPLNDPTRLNIYARISLDSSGTILQLAPRALHLNLLDAVVISAVLLMSGRNID